jgi:hypothetical protein
MAAREDGSQEDYVSHTISHVEPDYKEAQPILGWMKAFSVTPRLGLLMTDTIYLFNVKSRCNTRYKATDSLIEYTNNLPRRSIYCSDMLHYDIAHYTDA